MGTVKLWVGSQVVMQNGIPQDDLRSVSFQGELVYSVTRYQGNDTRGVTEALYKTEDGRLVVHVDDWSKWQGEPDVSSLVKVTEKDLSVGGRFEQLGRGAGYGRALTLDEALENTEKG